VDKYFTNLLIAGTDPCPWGVSNRWSRTGKWTGTVEWTIGIC